MDINPIANHPIEQDNQIAAKIKTETYLMHACIHACMAPTTTNATNPTTKNLGLDGTSPVGVCENCEYYKGFDGRYVNCAFHDDQAWAADEE